MHVISIQSTSTYANTYICGADILAIDIHPYIHTYTDIHPYTCIYIDIHTYVSSHTLIVVCLQSLSVYISNKYVRVQYTYMHVASYSTHPYMLIPTYLA